MTRKLVVLLALCHGALSAQQQPLVGTWQVHFQSGMRIENGEATPLFATGTLTVQPVSDLLIGTLVADPSPDTPARPPVRLAAKASSGEATFIANSKATINVNGAEHEAAVVSTWVLRAQGDSLVGTWSGRSTVRTQGRRSRKPVTGVRKTG